MRREIEREEGAASPQIVPFIVYKANMPIHDNSTRNEVTILGSPTICFYCFTDSLKADS